MEIKDMLVPLLVSMEQINCTIVVKDFVGFLTWEPALGAVLLPYVGHHASFCLAVKQNSEGYKACVQCSHIYEWFCNRLKAPFFKPCFLGVSEYTVPIFIDDLCIGALSAGLYCQDQELTQQRTLNLAQRCGMNISELQAALNRSIVAPAPGEEAQAVFRYIAMFIGEVFRPFAHKAKERQAGHNTIDAAFDNILHYIFDHYRESTLSVASIAHACNYSESHVSHTFASRMNMNIRPYINQLRILMAKHELVRGCSILETAGKCGFNDANYFCNVFRAQVGIAPSTYARHARKTPDKLFPSD